MYFNSTNCGNPCAPPTSSDYIGGKVVPQSGWKRNGSTINICVDPQFGTSGSTALAGGAVTALTAEGLLTNVIYNLTDSRCSATAANHMGFVYNGNANAAESALTQVSVGWANSGQTAVYTEYATTTVYMGNNPFLPELAKHEAFHADGLADDYASGCAPQTYMWYQNINTVDSANGYNVGTNTDQCAVDATMNQGNGAGGTQGGGCGGVCTGTQPVCVGSQTECNTNTCQWYCQDGAPGCYPPAPAPCCNDCYVVCEVGGWACIGSPIVIDTAGVGFHFTSVPNGVTFRVLPGQGQHQMSWPEASFHNGWLALDRDGDGDINDFTELFGNATPQPKTTHPNGYLALAVFDDPANGGNGNGVIDPGDVVYSHLRVWIDDNHNGVSEPNELHTLPEVGIFRIDLTYYLAWYVDENGNVYRYKSKIWDEAGQEHDVCYDVFVHIAY